MENKCKCCEKYQFKYSYEICPICGWQNDILQNDDENFFGGANQLCLKDYKYFYNKGLKFLNSYITKINNDFINNINILNIEFILSNNYKIKFKYKDKSYEIIKNNNEFLILNRKKEIVVFNLDQNIIEFDGLNIEKILKLSTNISIKQIK